MHGLVEGKRYPDLPMKALRYTTCCFGGSSDVGFTPESLVQHLGCNGKLTVSEHAM